MSKSTKERPSVLIVETRVHVHINLGSAVSGFRSLLAGAGGDSSPTAPTGTSSVTGTVSANHGHVAVLTSVQLMSDVDISLSITGSSDHPHTVAITATELDRIAAGTQVSKESSSDDGHTHVVTFN